MGLFDSIKTSVSIREIKKIDWGKKGENIATITNGFADESLGKKSNKRLFAAIILAANQFVMGFTKKLNELTD